MILSHVFNTWFHHVLNWNRITCNKNVCYCHMKLTYSKNICLFSTGFLTLSLRPCRLVTMSDFLLLPLFSVYAFLYLTLCLHFFVSVLSLPLPPYHFSLLTSSSLCLSPFLPFLFLGLCRSRSNSLSLFLCLSLSLSVRLYLYLFVSALISMPN